MNPTIPAKTRQTNLDLLECLSLLFIMNAHSLAYSTNFLDNPGFLTYSRYFLYSFTAFPVPLFFFINGYLLLNKPFDMKKHMRKTLRYALITILWGIIKILLLMPIKGEYLGVKEFFLTLASLRHGWIHTLWFMGAMVGIYIFFPILKITFDNDRRVFVGFMAVAAVLTFGNTLVCNIVTFVSTRIFHSNYTVNGFNWLSVLNPFRDVPAYALVYFCMGGLAYKYKDDIPKYMTAKKTVAAAGVVLLCVTCVWLTGIVYSKATGRKMDSGFNGMDSIFALVGAPCIFAISFWYKKDYKIVRAISECTLGIYLVHDLFVELLRPVIASLSWTHNVPFSWVYTVFLVLLSLGTVKLMKKIPGLRFLV